MAKNGLGLETELRLGLPGGSGRGGGEVEKNEKKRVFSDFSGGGEEEEAVENNKNQVVGWPPVCAFRRKNSFKGIKMYVKVSMDGAPFLRKIDLSMHKGYSDLVMALEKLFGCFGIEEALKDADNCEMFIESCKRLRIMKRSDAKGIGLHAKDLLKGLAKEE
ncbi:hypothetical protein BUALT_Bualt07G0136500 [Buddleja alternifolia]|uniref:Auxin-responsive protein n=1 Tax=Buddleja alternifolia TaxID=168488 RepID=A0AAV6XIP1_9LAMI|nr:hypothetical protein BUALT_Bualt07G0136500 [Buddleja alternifolia]